jgi:hypothetical protein
MPCQLSPLPSDLGAPANDEAACLTTMHEPTPLVTVHSDVVSSQRMTCSAHTFTGCHHIGVCPSECIDSVGNKLHVCGVATQAISAKMVHHQPGRNRAVDELPYLPVREHFAKSPIAVGFGGTGPGPALGVLSPGNFRPGINSTSKGTTVWSTEPSGARRDLMARPRKTHSALLADAGYASSGIPAFRTAKSSTSVVQLGPGYGELRAALLTGTINTSHRRPTPLWCHASGCLRSAEAFASSILPPCGWNGWELNADLDHATPPAPAPAAAEDAAI